MMLPRGMDDMDVPYERSFAERIGEDSTPKRRYTWGDKNVTATPLCW